MFSSSRLKPSIVIYYEKNKKIKNKSLLYSLKKPSEILSFS